ncbi:CLUMA_CG004032, isoform A [Clunio marinus]|uniref:CLUMA_CG004032, isoform A n=1 Tax=Clunio marinus TaxID=568069 RepID=A0A1J1HSF7_9DIPT|nr:CLUMA_CG004032, isoform A [Clunio marinus]
MIDFFLGISLQHLKFSNEIYNPGLKYWLHTRYSKNYHGFESIEVIIKKTKVDSSTSATIHYYWDLLWAFEYIRQIPLNYSKLKHYQRINHIPGIIHLVLKSFMATNTDLKYVPKAFTDIEELTEYANKHPEKRFVQKFKANRGVSIKKVSEMNLTDTKNINQDYFAQEYVEDPFFIDGHKFDLNIFVVITSVDPLRVYYYGKTYHFRFCNKPYDPNNFKDVETYAVGDPHIPGLNFTYVETYFKKTYLAKEVERNFDPQIVDEQIEDCIRKITLMKEPKFIEAIAELKAAFGKNHFFELLRFDFILDSKLQLYLMEVNMSPNLEAHARIRNTKPILENVLYNFFRLIGIEGSTKNSRIRNILNDKIFCQTDGLTVLPEICMKKPCNESCDNSECDLCWNCMDDYFITDLRTSYYEHMNIGDFVRVIPP